MDMQMESPECPHFALLYIDDDGKLRFEASSSIAEDCHNILSPEVTHSFLRAVALSGDAIKPIDSSDSVESQSKSPPSPDSTGTPCHSRRSSFSQHLDHHMKRKRVSHEYVVPMSITCYPKTVLPISNQSLLRKYYAKAFDSLQQTNCRILAKAYIKLVEPRKQVNFPYNGRKHISGTPQQFDPETTKPAWWPTGVTHREPDHLRKPARIRLLVHILCELRESHAICVEKLKEADQSIRRQISPERLQVLDEIYRVRGEEENYLNGKLDDQAVVCVSRVHVPDTQTSLYSPSSSSHELDAMYRDEIRDLESHTSVFPSSSSSPASPAEVEEPAPPRPVSSTAPASWAACASALPASLPPVNPTLKPVAPDAATNYALDFSTPYANTTTIQMPTFNMGYYPSSQIHQSTGPTQGVSHTQNPIAIMRPSGNELGGYSQPYYFHY